MDKRVKDMLVNGEKTPDELRAILEKEITAAQEEMKQEKETSDLDQKRHEAVAAAFDYLIALDVIDSDAIDSDMFDTAVETLAEMENEIKKYAKILTILMEDMDLKEDDKKKEVTFKPISLTKFASKDIDIDEKMDELVAKVMKGIL